MAEYVGLDVHKKNFHATVMGEDGEILRRQRFPNSLEEVKSFFSDIEMERLLWRLLIFGSLSTTSLRRWVSR